MFDPPLGWGETRKQNKRKCQNLSSLQHLHSPFILLGQHPAFLTSHLVSFFLMTGRWSWKRIQAHLLEHWHPFLPEVIILSWSAATWWVSAHLKKVYYAGGDLIRIILPTGLPWSLPESKQMLYKELSSIKLSYSWIFILPLEDNLALLLLIGLINLGTKDLHLHRSWTGIDQLLNISLLLTDWSILCSKTSQSMIKPLPLLLFGSGNADNFILSQKKKSPNWRESKWWAKKRKKKSQASSCEKSQGRLLWTSQTFGNFAWGAPS